MFKSEDIRDNLPQCESSVGLATHTDIQPIAICGLSSGSLLGGENILLLKGHVAMSEDC